MTLTSLEFFVFFALSVIFYYLFPKKYRWICLLACSAVFFILSTPPAAGLYLILCIIITHFGSLKICHLRRSDTAAARKILICVICADLFLLALCKYNGFFLLHWNVAASRMHLPAGPVELSLLIPLGISFYTLQAVGMVADTWRGISQPESNLFKTALFIGFYPQLTAGPIARYGEMRDELFNGHDFSWVNFTHGLQRMIWGLFKKLVLSSRLAVLVDAVYGNAELYTGFYIWAAAGLFMLQLYTDFSGCMDIIIGAAETYGIVLPENFRTPFFAQTIQEFWQRWHITLGSFMRDYAFFPIQRSKVIARLRAGLEKHFGKKTSDRISVWFSLLCIWLVIGLWHGGAYKFILGHGLWFWLCIVAERTAAPIGNRLTGLLKIRTDNFSWRLFRSLRTFTLVSFGNIFFRAGSLKGAFHILHLGFSAPVNFHIFLDGSFAKMGLTEKELVLTAAGLLILLLVSVISRNGSVRQQIDHQNLAFRWLLYFLLIFAVIIFGKYGPGCDAADFIYKGF